MTELFAGWESANVLSFFEQISAIPRGSGNEAGISNFLMQFAKDHRLEAEQDEALNVLIRKPGQNGGETAPFLALQGHMDMVCEKLSSCTHDFQTEGIELLIQDGALTANGTTLGADDGIAVAMMLAILEDKEMTHPPLECLFTTGEEIGLIGASKVSPTWLRSTQLINLDSEEEGVCVVGSAGGARVDTTRAIRRHEAQGFLISITIEGLLGGHSGTDIDLNHCNAILLMARTLSNLFADNPYVQLVDFNGGGMDNAIPRECYATVLYRTSDSADRAIAMLEHLRNNYHDEIRPQEPDFKFHFRLQEDRQVHAMTAADGQALASAILLTPNGVLSRNAQLDGAVVSSSNLGIVRTEDASCTYACMARSSVDSLEEEALNRIRLAAEAFGFTMAVSGRYPGWAYQEVSPLRDCLLSTYRSLFSKDMKVEALHAGLETGLLVSAMDGLDAVSVGPDLFHVHTPDEKMPLDSLARFYTLLTKVLTELSLHHGH